MCVCIFVSMVLVLFIGIPAVAADDVVVARDQGFMMSRSRTLIVAS